MQDDLRILTDTKEIGRLIRDDPDVRLVAVVIEGGPIHRDLLAEEVIRRILEKPPPAVSNPYPEFCKKMGLMEEGEQGKESYALYTRLIRVPLDSVQGFRTHYSKKRRGLKELGINNLADLCRVGLGVLKSYNPPGFNPFYDQTLKNLREFAERHGVTLPE